MHVRLLGVTLSSDLSFDRHISIVSASSFYWLCQLQRSRRSLDTKSAPTLVHSFVASRIDYCNAVLAGAPKATTNKLQRVLNAAAVWSAVPISSTEACHDSSIPSYIGWMFLSESCTNSASWCSTVCTVKHLSTSWNCANQSQVSHHANIFDPLYPTAPGRTGHRLSSCGRRAFCVAGPSVWNSLPDSLRNLIIGENSFRQSLKTFLFATYWCIQRIRGFTTMRYINRLFTYLLLLTASSLVAIAQYFWRIRTSLFFVYQQKFNIEAVNDYPPIRFEIRFEF